MLPRAAFGATGHRSTRVIFGAAALGAMSEQRAASTLASVSGWGINHIDTANSYGDSELRLAPWLTDHRGEVFLATKTKERDGPAARAGLEHSLERMRVDSVDLIQLHNLVDADEWERAFAPGGAVEALAAARDEGLVEHVGVTGHGVQTAEMHLRSLERFEFASVLLPVNFVMMENQRYRRDVERLLDVCAERSVAVQTIKSIARGLWPDGTTRRFSWYEPLTRPEPIGRAVRYVLSHPQMFLNTSSDARLLPLVVGAAEGDLSAPSRDAMLADTDIEGITPLFAHGQPIPI